MMRLLAVSMMATMFMCAGCAVPTNFNVSNDAINSLSGTSGGTYSSYGGKVEYNDENKLHVLTVFVGGRGGCDDGAILYAKPKLDDFMKANQFSSYTIIKGEYTLFPLSKCVLYAQFAK